MNLTLCFTASSTKDIWPKFKIWKQERITKKISYERRDYESVDEKSLS